MLSGLTHFRPMLFKFQLYLIPFSLLNDTSLYGYITFCLSIHKWMNGWVILYFGERGGDSS